jgi:phage terminase large subunit GpA-like protein
LSAINILPNKLFMKAAQAGATEAGNNWIGYVIHHAPGPMLAVQPTVELAKRNSRQRISADRGDVEGVRRRHSGDDRRQLRRRPALDPGPLPFLDEIDAYPASADEGDPITLAEACSLTFAHRRKVFLVSTPTTRRLSRIEREYGFWTGADSSRRVRTAVASSGSHSSSCEEWRA